MVARVRIEPDEGRALLQAELVDVSAGGLRARCAGPCNLSPGRAVSVEITVQESGSSGSSPLVNLSGRGEVVRLDEHSGDCHTALRFTGALSLREPFAQMLLF